MEGLKYFLIISLLKMYVHAEDPLIKTNPGKIRGLTTSVQNTDIDIFLGIPFAKPPIRNLRFRKPEPVEPWRGIKETRRYVSSCVQLKDTAFGDFEGANMWNPNTNMSEDCLYLNIWAPSEARRSRSNLTTMIWIYGGGFVSGSSTLDLYDGRWLAASQNIIVASLNYRLGPFGFLSLNDKRAPGNMGLQDQTLAIKWIRDNIALFGGDPNKLTLFGESAGSASVSLQVISPISRNLFRNAIMMSGTSNTNWAIVPIEKNIARAKDMAVYLKCPTENTTLMLDCFLNADAEKLAIGQFHNLNSFMGFTFCPVIDNFFLKEKQSKILQDKTMKKDVLIGFLKNEGNAAILYKFPKYFPFEGIVPINKSTGNALIKRVLEPMHVNSQQLDFISYLYGSRVYSSSQTEKYRYILDQVAGDTLFKCPAIEFAQDFSTHSNVYMYSFEFRSRVNPWPKWAGMMHGYEIEFVFAQALSGKNYSRQGTLLTEMVTSYFANFSKSGNPNNGDCSDCSDEPWPKFTPKSQKYIVLDAKPKLETKENYMNNICGFWSDVLPKLNDPPKVNDTRSEQTSGSQNIWTFQWSILTSLTSILFSLMLFWNILY